MILDNIKNLCDSAKYEEADTFLKPKKRELNRSIDFKSALMLSADNIKHLKR